MNRRQQHRTKPSTSPALSAAGEMLADRAFSPEPAQQAPEVQALPNTPTASPSIAAAPARVGQSRLLQAKLTISAPNDPYEQEADRVAEQVTRAQAPPRIQRAATASAGADVTPEVESGISRLRGGGQPLDAATRATMETRIGHHFGQVRIHTDARAADLSSQVRARAFTVGSDLAFAPGQYQPGSAEGQRLLAHELTHVVQQGGRPTSIQRYYDAASNKWIDGKVPEGWVEVRKAGNKVYYGPKELKEQEDKKLSDSKAAKEQKQQTQEAIWRAKQQQVTEAMAPFAEQFKSLDKDALLQVRGSLARGLKGPGKTHPNGKRRPFDPLDFDVDAYVVSDTLFQQAIEKGAAPRNDGEVGGRASKLGKVITIINQMANVL
jgi:hypothetical protein